MKDGKLLRDIDGFIAEANFVYEQLVLPNWCGVHHGLPDALYGYMMGLCAKVDLLASIIYPDIKNQTDKMVRFLKDFIDIEDEVSNALIYIWRHKLMHTASPQIIALKNGIQYGYLIHWKEHLPHEQHLTFTPGEEGKKVLNIGMLYFAEDVKRGIEKFYQCLKDDKSLAKKLSQYLDKQLSEIKPFCQSANN